LSNVDIPVPVPLLTTLKRLTPQFAFDGVRGLRSRRADAAAARAVLHRCLGDIRLSFPKLTFRQARLVQTGFDHVIVIIDESFVFRFPLQEYYRVGLLCEVRLLQELQKTDTVLLPQYSFLPRSGLFGGYAMLEGRDLRPTLFRRLSRAEQEHAVAQVADFLSTLHSLPATVLTRPDGTIPSRQDDPRFSHCDFERRGPYMAGRIDRRLIDAMACFFAAWSDESDVAQRVVHGDLVQNHMLLDRDNRVGILDFGEASLGDPAWDFAILGSYAPWVGPFMLARYKLAAQSPGLLERATRQAVRFWSERLFYRLNSSYRAERISEISAMLWVSLEQAGI
jgi:aminoglycoside 2''-phosphotransferase